MVAILDRPHGLTVIHRDTWMPDELRAKVRAWTPRSGLGAIVKDCLHYLRPELAAELFQRITACLVTESSLAVIVFRADGKVEDHGVVSRRLVTDTGRNAIVDAFRNLVELETFNYHGIGTGTTAESVAQTALITELTTQLNPDNVRATGTQAEPTPDVYRSTGINVLDATVAITEHGLLSSATVAAGVLLDRSVFSAINLAALDSLSTQYDFTVASGG